MIDVKITEMALLCLADIESDKRGIFGIGQAAVLTESLLMESVVALREDAKRYRYNSTLADFGLEVRERLDERGYPILFEEQGEQITVLLILSIRQDLIKALYRFQLFC